MAKKGARPDPGAWAMNRQALLDDELLRAHLLRFGVGMPRDTKARGCAFAAATGGLMFRRMLLLLEEGQNLYD